ncbi:translation protein SH3-like domain-containing protein [Auriculariales sp. MPI-PUGE-AT-0066]|nr:translation protein SH3-like domain-containing protein [Auriculariales sp. MPI-PUGE-AT-0066]
MSTAHASHRYRFATNVTCPEPTPEPINPRLLRGKGLMAHINNTIPSPQTKALMSTLFSKQHPDRLLPGSVMTLHLTHHPTLFSGVLIGLRRKGPNTSFTLRNVINRIGTEMTFFVGSPHLKKIDIIQRAGKGSGGLGRKSQRSKYYFLRDSAEKMSQISAGVAKK